MRKDRESDAFPMSIAFEPAGGWAILPPVVDVPEQREPLTVCARPGCGREFVQLGGLWEVYCSRECRRGDWAGLAEALNAPGERSVFFDSWSAAR